MEDADAQEETRKKKEAEAKAAEEQRKRDEAEAAKGSKSARGGTRRDVAKGRSRRANAAPPRPVRGRS